MIVIVRERNSLTSTERDGNCDEFLDILLRNEGIGYDGGAVGRSRVC